MESRLTKISCSVLYLDEIFRSGDYENSEQYKECSWYKLVDKMTGYSDSYNMRVVMLDLEDLDKKYHIIQEMIASFDDEATLILLEDNFTLSDKYSEINMYHAYTDDSYLIDNKVFYVYENAAGSWLLDQINKGRHDLWIE